MTVLAVVLAMGWFWVPRTDSWIPLEPGLGRIRWVGTRVDPIVQPPLAPDWVRRLHDHGIPWPTDLLDEPAGASFGSGGGPVAWYVVESTRESLELWRLDKASVQWVGLGAPPAVGQESVESGAVAHPTHQRRQFLYLGIPPSVRQSSSQGRLRLQLIRGRSESTQPVDLPF